VGIWDAIKGALGGTSGGQGRGIDDLAARLGTTPDALRSAKVAYRTFEIAKRSGGKRRIAAPEPELKALQRTILRKLLARLPVHAAANGFERGRSIATNARPHVGKAVLLRMDLKDFFGSTTSKRVREYFLAIGWNAEAASLLERLCTKDGSLPQGAPTSPRLSNLLNVRLDARLSTLATRAGATYTRYADDLTFSLPEDDPAQVRRVIRAAKLLLGRDGYEINHRKKVRIRRAHERQEVTGLVVNVRVRLPRRTRRLLRAARARAAQGGQPTLTKEQLAGWSALERMLELQGK
jgi:retron-type reverse transcriptase